MEITTSNGRIIAKDFIDRKTMRSYRKALLSNPKNSFDTNQGAEQKITITPLALERANDILVRGVVNEAYIGDKKVELDDTFFDDINQADFDKVLTYATELVNKKDVEKKS